jgi:hypothetical protein
LSIEQKEDTYPYLLNVDEKNLFYRTKTFTRNIIHKRQLSKKEFKHNVLPKLKTGTNKETLVELSNRPPVEYKCWFENFRQKY